MTIQQICTFFLNNTRFGIEVKDVQEIIRQQPLTRVPLAAPDICGLMNLRGQVIPVVDLPCRLGLRAASCGVARDDIAAGDITEGDITEQHRKEEKPVYNVIVNTSDDIVSFTVDDIGDVLECSVETLEPPPVTLNPHIRSSLKGAYKLEHDFLLVLNTRKILDPALSGRY